MEGTDCDPTDVQEAWVSSLVAVVHVGVTAPQLALLETTMLQMERVQTWVLMMGGGSGVDVFLVCILRGTYALRRHCCIGP